MKEGIAFMVALVSVHRAANVTFVARSAGNPKPDQSQERN
jgi:hypothetical protein